jgi:hypothetical protein
MNLIARWTSRQDSNFNEPHSVEWEDGTPATVEDYRNHSLDTYKLVSNRTGEIEQHIFPAVVGEVVFAPDVHDWVLTGSGVATTALDIKNTNVSNDEIYAALATFPTVYRVRIVHP